MQWLQDNWHLLAYALAGIAVVGATLWKAFSGNKNLVPQGTNITINNSNSQGGQTNNPERPTNSHAQSAFGKDNVRILFIDDDTSFQVVKILRKAGWSNTKIVKDVTSLDSTDLRDANLLFVDIQGVGKAMNFKASAHCAAAKIQTAASKQRSPKGNRRTMRSQ